MSAAAPRHDTIAEHLRSEILRGTYRPGDRLPAERDLASRLRANRGSVREALRKLEQQGLVAIRHGGGATVRAPEHASLEVVRHMVFVDGRLDRALLEQLLEVHEMLVAGATRLAVERADADEIDAARELLRRITSPAASDDDFIDGAAALLELIARASRNLVLRLARNAVDPLFEERFRAVRRRLRPPAELLEPAGHALDAAIAARDAAAADAAVRSLLRLNRTRILDTLAALPDVRAPEPPTA